MARPSMQGMTITRLESMLNQQRSKKKEMMRERASLQAQLEKLDHKIAGLDGGAGGFAMATSGGRARNEKSLVATLEEVLEKNPKGMSIGEIVTAVQAAGYKSSSPNFRGIINQTLIKERKRFAAVSRGTYAIIKK